MAKRKPGKRITTKAVQASENVPVALPDIIAKPEPDEGEWGDDSLNVRQRLFIEALIGPAGGNQSKAAEIAGYRCDNANSLAATASEVLRNPNVQQGLARALARKRLSPEWTRDRLLEIAGSTMATFVLIRDGKAEVDWDAVAKAGAVGQIKELTEDVLPGGDGKSEVIRRKVKLHDPMPALALLAKFHNLVIDRTEHSGTINHNIDLSKLTEDELRDLLRIREQHARRSGLSASPDSRN